MQASEVYLDIAPPALPKECEAVYSADVAITVGVLEDRVNTRVTWIKWVGGVIGTVLAFLILRSITQGEKLAEISGKLDLIVAEQRKQVPTTVSELLRKHPSDDAEKVSQRLTLAAAVLSNALAQEKESDPAPLRKIGVNIQDLAQVYPTMPAVWATAGQLITYRSQIEGPRDLVRSAADLPACTAESRNILPPLPVPPPVGAWTRKVDGFVYKQCSVDLDDEKIKVGLGISTDSERSLPLGVTFRECLVKYQGAYIDLPENVYFRQCLFVVTLGTPPNERRGFVSALLLAPDLNTVDDISR